MPIPVIIFLGAPGAGKGTQAAYLSRQKLLPKISTGDMLRRAVLQETELGCKVKEIMNDGGLVDDDTMLSLVKERISQPDCQHGFILDGYPRTLKQATQLESILEPTMLVQVFKIEVPPDVIVKRLAGRRTCPVCQKIYNMYFHPPKENERCDTDGARLFRREDDSEGVVRKRLATYEKETYPLIDYYRKKGVLRIINGTRAEQEIAGEILSELCL